MKPINTGIWHPVPHFFIPLMCVLLIVVGHLIVPWSAMAQREMSELSKLYNALSPGVVSVISTGHGSGFLVDKEGIIITNNHVVNDAGKEMIIRFGAGKVVIGKVVLQDRRSDLAVVLVNLAQIQDYTVLKMYHSDTQTPLVYPGEKIFAIGSPLNWHVLEKTLTDGIASKVQEGFIMSNVNINPGNSGGPLFNFDGDVIGVNTFFIPGQGGPGVSGSMSIELAKPLVTQVKTQLSSGELTLPSAALLPDYPTDVYPIADMMREVPHLLPAHVDPYAQSGKDFEAIFSTPPLGYKQQLAIEKITLENRADRVKKGGYRMREDEYESKNRSFSDDILDDKLSPTVKVTVMPKQELKASSKFLVGLSVVASAFAGQILPVDVESQFKADLDKVMLVNQKGTEVCKPLLKGKVAITSANQSLFWGIIRSVSLLDKTYTGMYEYDPACFVQEPLLALKVIPEGTKEPSLIPISLKTQRAIFQDFKPYWTYRKLPIPKPIPEILQKP